MPFFDFPLDKLKTYLPTRDEPKDFDSFWRETLAESRQYPLNAQFEPVDYGLQTIETFDVTFNGFGGQPIKGWLLMPRHRSAKLPCVVEFIGYGGGRGFPLDWLTWASAGYVHLVMDTRGQGSMWRNGDTPDSESGGNPQAPGFMTRGVLDPKTYYYRRVFTDAVRAVETAQMHQVVDTSRIAVTGSSQGGGITLAVSGLMPDAIQVAMPDVPFLCHYRRATQIIGTQPYVEISNFCKTHRDKVEQVFHTLSYFDGLNFAARAKAQALFSVGLMDDICPPSTVYAAYNYYAGAKQIENWEYNNHEGGGTHQLVSKIRFLNNRYHRE